MDCRGEACAGELLNIGDGLIHGEDGASQSEFAFGLVSEGEGPAVCDLNLHGAEGIDAIGHASGGHAVCDEDGARRPLGFEPKANHLWSDMDAIADELRVESGVVEDGGDDSWVTVV